MRSDPDEISDAFLTHLEREEAALNRSLDVLRQVRSALLRSDLGQLTALRGPQDHVAAESARLRQDRDRLRRWLANALGLPAHTASLSTLTAAMPVGYSERLWSAGAELRRLALEADGLVRSNAALVAHLVRFSRSFLFEITGGDEAAERYGPDGTHVEASFGSLLSTRG